MQFEIHPGKTAVVIASTETHNASGADTLRRNEIARRAALRAAAPVDDPLVADWPPPPISSSSNARAICTPSSPAITGSATGAATP